jgi:hypothetical protein
MAGYQDAPENEKQEVTENYVAPTRKATFPYTQILTVLILLLQSVFIIRLWSANPTSPTSNSHHEESIERRWHRNTSYMSLDHVYDGLWNETGQSALVFDDEKNVVQITMQVFVITFFYIDFKAHSSQGSTNCTAWPQFAKRCNKPEKDKKLEWMRKTIRTGLIACNS